MYDKICKTCGRSLSEFYRTYMLGCPDCYENFYTEIRKTLKKSQGKTCHVGKAPKISGVDRELYTEYEMLIRERENAILDGRFNKINELTEDINELAKELKRRGLI